MARCTYHYHRPRTLDEVFALRRAQPGSLLLAGGTDLMVRLHAGDLRPASLISLRGVPELRGISRQDGALRLGAAVTLGQLVGSPEVARDLPLLREAALRLGSPQIRNAATLGGNLCNASPCADTAPPLLALEARLELLGPGGPREVPLDDFFSGPGETRLGVDEVLGAVLVRPMEPGERGAFFKKGRVYMDLAQASVALLLRLDGDRCVRARAAAGSVAPTPVRLRAAEAALQGSRLSAEVLAEARRAAEGEVRPITDIRSTAGYRRQVVGIFMERAARRCLQEAKNE